MHGVPVAFSTADANSLLAEMGVDQKVLEHTRRVQRNTQSWILHLEPNVGPTSDTMHLEHAGRDFYITLSPVSARPPRNPSAKQFVRPQRPRSQSPPGNSEDFPALRGSRQPTSWNSPSPSDASSRTTHLEKLVASLVGLLASQGTQLPQSVQSLLHDANIQRPSRDTPMEDEELGPASLSEPENFDSEPLLASDSPLSEEPAKRRRQDSGPALAWAHVPPLPFQHLMWGNVKGDGNCLWRSIAALVREDWVTMKRRVLAEAPTLAAEWCKYFQVSQEEYEKAVTDQEPDFAWGTEIGIALAARNLKRAIVVVTPATIWMVSVGEVDLQSPLVIRLKGQHYDPLRHKITSAMIGAIEASTAASTAHLHLAGGASQLTSWNVSAFDLHAHELPRQEHSILALQETGCKESTQGYYSKVAERQGLQMLCGVPTPLFRDKKKVWRNDRGRIPGVAFQSDARDRALPIAPSTAQGVQLWKGGRFLLASVLLGTTRALVGTIYMPAGDSREAVARRRHCMDLLQSELESHEQIPFLIGGDWNCHPNQNPCLAAMSARGWQIPLHVDTQGDPCEATFVSSQSVSCLDYWAISPAVGFIPTQVVRAHPGHQHRSVTIQIPKLGPRPDEFAIPPPIRYEQQGIVSTCNPIDWESVHQELEQLVRLRHVDLASRLWEDAFHRELQGTCTRAPQETPGTKWKVQRQFRARVTGQGEESPHFRALHMLARRLLDFGKTGGARARQKIVQSFSVAILADFHVSLSEALSHPIRASEELFQHTQEMQAVQKRRQFRKWERQLLEHDQRPTPLLYKWLRGRAPASAPTLISKDGPVENMKDIFVAHRKFWESTCFHSEDRDTEPFSSWIQGLPEQTLPMEVDTILAAAKRLKVGTAPGLDNWPPEAVRLLSKQAAQGLQIVFQGIENTGCWPENLTRVKVALIAKPESPGTDPAHWRPISVTSVWYRLYAQIRMGPALQAVLPRLPPTVLGGIPGRGPEQAIMELLTSLESHQQDRPAPPLYGAALDASKCFDRIRWLKVFQLLLSWDVPTPVVKALSLFYLSHDRHTVINGTIDPVKWDVCAGLLQGCPLSILCAVARVATWHQSIPREVTAQSYIDDRLLLGASPDSLNAAWRASEDWNEENGWQVNVSKSLCFSSEAVPRQLPLQVQTSFAYLGHDIVTAPTKERKVLQKRAQKASDAAGRISRLPANMPIGTRKILIATIVGPRWAYGILGAPPSKLLIKQVDQHIREALWYRQKSFHSWQMAAALVYSPHKISAWAIQLYRHLKGTTRALSRHTTQVQRELWNGPPPRQISGPIHTMQFFLRQLGVVIAPDFLIYVEGQPFDLCNHSREFLKIVPDLAARVLLREASLKRAQFQDCVDADIVVAHRPFKNPSFPFCSELLCVIADGLWTGHRLQHAKHVPTPACWWCGFERQDAVHLYWHCPHWQAQRPALSQLHLQLILESPVASTCGVCLLHFPPELKSNWMQVQLHMCRIVRSCNQWIDKRAKEASATQCDRESDRRKPGPEAERCGPPRCDPFAPLPPGDVWLRSRYLDFTCLAGRKSHGLVWPFAQSQWNRLQNFMSMLRVPHEGDEDRVPRVSVLEVYAAYIATNGGVRFHTGLDAKERGEWITSHLELFGHALQSFQGLACYEEVICRPGERAEMEKWPTTHLPPSPKLKLKILLPHWQAARGMLLDLVVQVPAVSGSERPHADMWRRLALGAEGSQLKEHGTLPAVALVWRPPKRIPMKTRAPTWIREQHETRGFRAAISGHPAFHMDIDGTRFSQILKERGIANQLMMGRFFQAQHQQAQRTAKFLAHALTAKDRKMHITSEVLIGERPCCAACLRVGTLSKAFNWVQLPCPHVHDFDPQQVLAKLRRQQGTTPLSLMLYHVSNLETYRTLRLRRILRLAC